MLGSLCVYCGAADGLDPRHRQAASDLGHLLGTTGIELVYGGGRVGLMGAVADAALAAGGRVVGIIPEFLMNQEVGHQGLSELIVVPSMHARKQLMCQMADGFCALPGGLGTLDETVEIITWAQLGLHNKPFALIDIDGFWQPLLALVRHQAAAGFVRPRHESLLRVAPNVATLLKVLAA